LPGLKRTALPGGMLTSAPVLGLRPIPVLRGRTLNTPKPGEGAFHAFKHGLDCLLGLGLGDAGFSDNFVDNVELDHEQLRIYKNILNCG